MRRLREEYEAARERQRAALKEWQQVSHHVNKLHGELGEAGELDCEKGCGKKATRRCKGCDKWLCDEHAEACR